MKSLVLVAVVVLLSSHNFDFCYGILSGYPIQITDAPYMVFIETIINKTVDPNQAEQCGGAFIKERTQTVYRRNGRTTTRYSKFILTAGHCVILGDDLHKASPSDVAIIYGLTDYSKVTLNTFIQGVKAVHVHPQYNGTVSNGHDVAILELNREIELNGNNTASIRLNPRDVAEGTDVYAQGWGTNPNDTSSTSLYRADLEVYSYETCANSYPRETQAQLEKEQICALGPPPEYANVCQGDSGGPLVLTQNSMPTQVGLVSYGQTCYRANQGSILPTVFTKIADVMPFINSVTRGYGNPSNGQVAG